MPLYEADESEEITDAFLGIGFVEGESEGSEGSEIQGFIKSFDMIRVGVFKSNRAPKIWGETCEAYFLLVVDENEEEVLEAEILGYAFFKDVTVCHQFFSGMNRDNDILKFLESHMDVDKGTSD